MNKVMDFLREQGCEDVTCEENIINFITSNWLIGSITIWNDWSITEVIDGEEVEYINFSQLKASWMEGVELDG